jgi:ABC-type glycerol-3-phosphate transport system substrate-binding protein
LPGDYLEIARTNAAAGTLADAIYLQSLHFEGQAVCGHLQPVDALVRRDKVELKHWYDNAIGALRRDGKLFGLPARGQIDYCYLFYNQDAFQQAGVREPIEARTLDDLVAATDSLNVRDGSRFGYATVWGNFQHTLAAIRRFGGDLLSPDAKKSLADTPPERHGPGGRDAAAVDGEGADRVLDGGAGASVCGRPQTGAARMGFASPLRLIEFEGRLPATPVGCPWRW